MMTDNNVYPFLKEEDIRNQARGWIIRFNRDNEPSPSDIEAFRHWVAISPTHLKEIKRAEAIWAQADCLSELAAYGLPPVKSNTTNRGFIDKFSLSWPQNQFIASGLFLLLVLTPILLVTNNYFPTATLKNGSYATAIGQQSELILEDRSTILLDTDSQIKVEYDNAHRKISLLKGKAYFKVAKNLKRPFEVYTESGVIRAVGTAFSVSLSQQDSYVLVNEGKVDVARIVAKNTPYSTSQLLKEPASATTTTSVFAQLKQGESLVFDHQHEQVSSLNSAQLLEKSSWQTGTLIFNGEPLQEVIDEISRYTPMKIEISDPFISQRPIGGRFKVGEIHALLESLEAGFGIKVTYINNNHIILNPIENIN
ncbi:MAG: FecR domain-containing protein [Spongiibacteraceae bacterium]